MAGITTPPFSLLKRKSSIGYQRNFSVLFRTGFFPAAPVQFPIWNSDPKNSANLNWQMFGSDLLQKGPELACQWVPK